MLMKKFIAMTVIIMGRRLILSTGIRIKAKADSGIPTSRYGIRLPYLVLVRSLSAPNIGRKITAKMLSIVITAPTASPDRPRSSR